MASFGTLLRAGGSLDLRCTRGIPLAAGGADFFWERSVDACMVVVVVCGAITLDI